MLRPSPKLLFKAGPALGKLHIHQPLPLSQRESKQLLDVLKTSFRQHLDTQHPFQIHDASQTSSQSHAQPRRRRSNSDSAAHRADRHLHSVLTNPLFRGPDPRYRSSAEDHMAVFEMAVSKGMMNLSHAHVCLIRVKKMISSSGMCMREGMKNSGAGLKVLKWLVSSGIANKNDFLLVDDPPFPAFGQQLMDFMVAEGLQDVAWTWVERGIANRPKLSGESRTKAHRDIIQPLMLLLRAETREPNFPLDSCYLYLSRAAELLRDLPQVQQRLLLGPPGSYLVQKTIYGIYQTPSIAGFESFLRLVSLFTSTPDLTSAYLNLRHPTSPNAEFALDYLRKTSSILESTPMRYVPGTKLMQLHIMLGLDTAKLLLEKNRTAEAEWVMEFLRTKFPKDFGMKPDAGIECRNNARIEMADAEVLSMRLLDSLSPA